MTIDEFWEEFLISSGMDMTAKYFDCFYFDVTKESANKLLDLVLSGQKRATASSLLAFECEGLELPKVGNYSIVTDFDNNPRCVIKTTTVTILPFNEMTFDICKREGEDNTLESWQKGHRNFFAEDGKVLGYEFTESMPVVFEDFEVIFAK